MQFQEVKKILLEPMYNKLQLITAIFMIVGVLKEEYVFLIIVTCLFLMFTYYSKKNNEVQK